MAAILKFVYVMTLSLSLFHVVIKYGSNIEEDTGFIYGGSNSLFYSFSYLPYTQNFIFIISVQLLLNIFFLFLIFKNIVIFHITEHYSCNSHDDCSDENCINEEFVAKCIANLCYCKTPN
jgi:hypothetical protein